MAVYYDGQVVANQVVYAALGNWILGKLKTSEWFPFINETTYYANKFGAIIIAGVSAMGINHVFSYTPDGTFTAVFTGLTIIGMWEGFKQFMFSYILQQGMYNTMKWKETK